MKWAKSLFGSDPWRNGSLAQLELGWCLFGYLRAVLDVACRRAAMLRLPADDVHLKICLVACTSLGTWASASKQLLCRFGLRDTLGEGFETAAAYKQYVKSVLVAAAAVARRNDVDRHVLPFPYQRVLQGNTDGVGRFLRLGLAWETLAGIRSWSRLRLGLLVLCARGGRKSRAFLQLCICCGEEIVAAEAYNHVVCECPRWAALQHRVREAQIVPLEMRAQAWLAIGPGSEAFVDVVALASAIDNFAYSCWADG